MRDRKAVIKSMYMDLHKHEFTWAQLIVLSWDLFRKNFSLILLIGIILNVPVFILDELLPGLQLSYLTELAIVAPISLFISLIITLSYYKITEGFLDGQSITISEAMGFSFLRLNKATWTGLITLLIVMAWSLLFIIPGIIWGVYYSFIIYVVAAKNIGGMKALSESKSLVTGRWWKVFGFSVYISLLIAAAALLMEYPIGWFTNGITSRITRDIISLILGGYATFAMTVLYINIEHSRNPNAPPQVE